MVLFQLIAHVSKLEQSVGYANSALQSHIAKLVSTYNRVQDLPNTVKACIDQVADEAVAQLDSWKGEVQQKMQEWTAPITQLNEQAQVCKKIYK